MRVRTIITCLCLLLVAGGMHAANGKGKEFFYRAALWFDNFTMKGLDTAYLTLPEYPFRVAFTNSEVGINSKFTVRYNDIIGQVQLQSVSTPSIDLGFHVGFRGLGFGYSWDALHAYAQKLNFSIGSKSLGIELLHQKTTNLNSTISVPDMEIFEPFDLGDKEVSIKNTTLHAWYAFNARHYSHNETMKQTMIQRRSAGSLLVSLSYLNSDISFGHDTTRHNQTVAVIMSGINKVVTHQVAAGVGYGINYTPNHGKVVLHASATMQVVFYSVNYISYTSVDTLPDFVYPSYEIKPTSPVHVAGTVRAAVSWEINKWVNMHVWAKADNLSFTAKSKNSLFQLQNWNWQANISIAVRFGVSKDKIRRELSIIEPTPQLTPKTEEVVAPEVVTTEKKRRELPRWVTDYFFSPH